MKYLLHIDTSADTGTIMLSGDGNIVAIRSNNEARNHAATINSMIDEVVTEAGITLQHIHAVVICSGPGSYTGLRIGMATAKGLCYALDKPLITTDRLTLLAYKTWLKNGSTYARYAAMLAARDKEFFIAIYDQSFQLITLPQHIYDHQLQALLHTPHATYLVTDMPENGVNELNNLSLIPDFHTEIDNFSWAKYALEQYDCNNYVNLATAEPLYLKQVYTHK